MSKGGKNIFEIEGIHYHTGQPVIIKVEDGIIKSIIVDAEINAENSKFIVAPGLIDNQVNGYMGIDFSGTDLSTEKVIQAAGGMWKDGVTTFLPTLLTNSHKNLVRNSTIIAEALRSSDRLGYSVPGIHLEGPYISSEEGYRGCHPLNHIRKPDYNELLEYQKAAQGKIIQVTIAPELEGAMQFIRMCVRDGIIVALGHTNASSYQIAEAVDNGARLSTHLGNGCANFIHRHNNVIWPQLANEKLTPSIIADGHHLTAEEIRVFYKVKGRENIILTSDVVYIAGMKPGKYTFLEAGVILTEDGMLFNPELNCLAGASFPLKKGVENIIRFTGCTPGVSIDMASVNVAEIYGLHDRGKISVGRRADLIIFERDTPEVKIRRTWLRGQLVFGE